MSDYIYTRYSVTAESELIFSYNCEICGHRNTNVQTLASYGTRESDSRYSKGPMNKGESREEMLINMAREANAHNEKYVMSCKTSLNNHTYIYPREKCTNCGSFQSFMPFPKKVWLKFWLWLMPSLFFLYMLIIALLEAFTNRLDDTQGMLWMMTGFAALCLIIPLIFTLRNLKRLKENKKLRSRENKQTPSFTLSPTYIKMATGKKILLEDLEEAHRLKPYYGMF